MPTLPLAPLFLHPEQHRRSRFGTRLLPLAAALVLGCQGDGLTPPPPLDPSQLYWALDLNHHAVTLSTQAPYDTLTLIATPRRVDGTVLPTAELPAPQYTSGDNAVVVVTSDGQLRARQPTSGSALITVKATLTIGNLKHVDSVIVKVVSIDPATLPRLTTFSIHPIPPDSAKMGYDRNITTTCFRLPMLTDVQSNCLRQLPVQVLDADQQTIPDVPVSIRSSDRGIANIDERGFIQIVGPLGRLTFYGSTTVFGVTKVDTLPFQIGSTLLVLVDVATIPFPPEIRLGTGGIVVWHDFNENPPRPGPVVDITFADPTHVAAVDPAELPIFLGNFRPLCAMYCGGEGNILVDDAAAPMPDVDLEFRRFPVPGTYLYHSAALGLTGRIIVADDE